MFDSQTAKAFAASIIVANVCGLRFLFSADGGERWVGVSDSDSARRASCELGFEKFRILPSPVEKIVCGLRFLFSADGGERWVGVSDSDSCTSRKLRVGLRKIPKLPSPVEKIFFNFIDFSRKAKSRETKEKGKRETKEKGQTVVRPTAICGSYL